MASQVDFKTYDPVAQLIASENSSGGDGLPLTGGTLTGNLNLQIPAKVIQCQLPINGCDLTNKTYVDGLIGGGPFLPLAGGTLTGDVTLTSPAKIQQTQAPTVGDDLTNKTYVDGLISGGPFLPLAGGTLTGDVTLTSPAKIQQTQAPTVGDDLTNKTYVDGLISGGPFLPLAGGTLTGDVILTSPAKIQQTQAPTVGDDLTNKTYVDGAFQAKQPLAVANNVAIFGSGADAGQTISSTFNIDTDVQNTPSNTTLWPSSRLIGALQYGANVYKATASIPLGPSTSVKAFSTGNDIMGPANWPSIGSTFSLAPTGIATISNSLKYATYYRIVFSANSLSESTNAFGTVQCQIQDENGPTFITIPKILNCLAAPPSFSNEVYLSCLVSVAQESSFNFSVILTNTGSNAVTIDPDAPDNVCILVIERVA
jgi:hypothetical protein